MLTVTDTDLSVTGRGLDLSVGRVYSELLAFSQWKPLTILKDPTDSTDTTFSTMDCRLRRNCNYRHDILSLSAPRVQQDTRRYLGLEVPLRNAFPLLGCQGQRGWNPGGSNWT